MYDIVCLDEVYIYKLHINMPRKQSTDRHFCVFPDVDMLDGVVLYCELACREFSRWFVSIDKSSTLFRLVPHMTVSCPTPDGILRTFVPFS